MYPLAHAEVIQTPLSQGHYTLNGQWYSVQDFCAKALDLDPSLWKLWTVRGRPYQGVASHEAAEVLRRHGYVVGAGLA